MIFSTFFCWLESIIGGIFGFLNNILGGIFGIQLPVPDFGCDRD
ncbi:MAG: hypothetical protein ACOX5J_14250 [Candidatus Hydrogenedentales bacterium]